MYVRVIFLIRSFLYYNILFMLIGGKEEKVGGRYGFREVLVEAIGEL